MRAGRSLSRRAELVERAGVLVSSLFCRRAPLPEGQDSAQRDLPMRGVRQLLRLQLASLDQTANMLSREAEPVGGLLRRKYRIRDLLLGVACSGIDMDRDLPPI